MSRYVWKKTSVLLTLLLVLFLLLGGRGPAFGAPAPAGPTKEGSSFLYIFAHRYLPDVFLREPGLALALALPQRQWPLLQTLWEICEQSYPDVSPAQPNGLGVESKRINDNLIYALVTFPKPQNMTEAYYACLMVEFHVARDKSLQTTSVGYYTLEKSMDLSGLLSSGKPEKQNIAESTVIGSWDKGRHVNLGPGPAPGCANAFRDVVMKIHAKRKK